jgi:uncharacterized NAD(P)/FAD-binding protein YdhS
VTWSVRVRDAEPRARTVAVIGAGFSGTLTACHLLRRGIRVALVEADDAVGRGFAYGRSAREHLVNVAAGKMSAWPGEPAHFADWLRARVPDATAATFALRSTYGDYLVDTLARASMEAPLDIVRDEAVDIDWHGETCTVRLRSRPAIPADAVVLALGHAPPRPLAVAAPAGRACRHVVQQPLAASEELAADREATVVLVGTGLTAVDIATHLRRRAHRGRIVAISPRGLLPLSHSDAAAPATPSLPSSLRAHPTVAGLTAWLYDVGASLATAGVPAVGAVDALRPYTADLWRAMPAAERARFLRHAGELWSVCRHRAAPEAAALIAAARADGSLAIVAGRYLACDLLPDDRLSVSVQRRGAATPTRVDADWLVNCTGPDRDLTRHPGLLVQRLLRQGVLQPDPLALGARTTASGQPIDAAGCAVPRTFVVGPWRAADLWESTAVPELREQAAAVAAAVCGTLSRRAEAP